MSKPSVNFSFGEAPIDDVVDPNVNEPTDDLIVDPNNPDPVPDTDDPVDPVDPDPNDDPNEEPNPDDPNPDDPPADVDIYTDLNTRLGLEIDGEFDDSVEGVAGYVKKAGEKLGEASMVALFDTFPDVAEFLQYRQNGGEPNKYFQNVHPEVDYGKMEIGPNDAGTQREVIRTLMKLQGQDEAYITETLADYGEANLLEKQANHAVKQLANHQKQEADNLVESARVQKENDVTAAREEWTSVQNIVNTGNLGNVIIPETEKKGFLEWMSVPVDSKGTTRRDADRAAMNTDTGLLLEYLIYKKADVASLVVNKQKSQKAQSLSQRLSNNRGVGSRMNSNTTTERKAPVKLPGIETFF